MTHALSSTGSNADGGDRCDGTAGHGDSGRSDEQRRHERTQTVSRPSQPGWAEMVIGLIAYILAFGAVFFILAIIPDELAVFNGIVQLGLSGLMGLFAFVVAVLIRIRGLAAFGITRASKGSLLLGAALGVGCWVLGTLVSLISYAINGGIGNVQGDYQAAAAGGVLAVVLTVLMGAVLTPIGEEFFFRGVITAGLLRFGPWVGIIASAALFALAHGINPVLPVAFIVGIVNGVLFHRTGSVWPGVVVHAFNNASALFIPLLIAPFLG